MAMAPSVNQAKIVIPTGFESQQRQLERKQAIAQALLERGIVGPGDHATSWAQPIASVVQALVGKHLQNSADKQQGALDSQISGAYGKRLSDFQQELQTMNPANRNEQIALMAKWGADPFVSQSEVYKAAVAGLNSRMTGEQGGQIVNGKYVSNSAMQGGQPLPQDMSKPIIEDGEGNSVVNPLAVTYANAAQGHEPKAGGRSPVYSMPDPRAGVAEAYARQKESERLGGPGAMMPDARNAQVTVPPVSGELPALNSPVPMTPQFSAQGPAGPQATPSNPGAFGGVGVAQKPGDIENGYIYLGGPKTDINSWRKAQ